MNLSLTNNLLRATALSLLTSACDGDSILRIDTDAGIDVATTDANPLDGQTLIDGAVADRPADSHTEASTGTLSLSVQTPYLNSGCEFASDIARVGTDGYLLCPPDTTHTNNRVLFFGLSSPVPVTPSVREDLVPPAGQRRDMNAFTPLAGEWALVTNNDSLTVLSTVATGRTYTTSLPAYPSTQTNDPTHYYGASGAGYLNGRVYVATSNYNVVAVPRDGGPPRLTPIYANGVLLSSNVNAAATRAQDVLTASNLPPLILPRKNPTGVAIWNDRVVIVCSGTFAREGGNPEDQQAAVIVYNPGRNMIERQIDLGTGPISVSPHISIDSTGLMVLGTPTDGRYFVLNVSNGTHTEGTITGNTFVSNTQILDGALAYVADFNREDRLATVFDTRTATTTPTRMTTTALPFGSAGPSLRLDGSCILQLGPNVGVRVCVGM